MLLPEGHDVRVPCGRVDSMSQVNLARRVVESQSYQILMEYFLETGGDGRQEVRYVEVGNQSIVDIEKQLQSVAAAGNLRPGVPQHFEVSGVLDRKSKLTADLEHHLGILFRECGFTKTCHTQGAEYTTVENQRYRTRGGDSAGDDLFLQLRRKLLRIQPMAKDRFAG